MVADLIAAVPEFETYSRFRELNIKNLLYYQVELALLRDQLTSLELKDWAERKMSCVGEFAKYADHLVSSPTLQNPRDRKQWNLVVKIRDRLKEYNAALLQHAQMSALPEPNNYDVEGLRVWLKNPNTRNYYIGGKGADVWGDLYAPEENPKSLLQQFLLVLRNFFCAQGGIPNRPDLVAIRPLPQMDRFSRWIADDLIPFFHTLKVNVYDVEKAQDESEVFSRVVHQKARQRATQRFTSCVLIALACLLPTVAIVVLSIVQKPETLLFYIVGFTAIFAVGLMFFANSTTSGVDIFTATAAFSAVMVVFVH